MAFQNALGPWLPGASRGCSGTKPGTCAKHGSSVYHRPALDGEALLGPLGADPKQAAVHADELMVHSMEHSFADYAQRARSIQGALLAQSSDPQHGLQLMQGAMATIESTNGVNRRTLYLGHAAAAHASLGQPKVGLDLLDEAIQTADKIDERFFEAELHRLRGEILLTLGRRDEAEDELRRALTVAQQQQARWWELRAATSPPSIGATRIDSWRPMPSCSRFMGGSSRVSTQHL